MAGMFSDARTLHFLTQLSSTTRAGLSLSRTLKILQENEGPATFRQVWHHVERAVARGSTFGEALQEQAPPVPPLCAELIKVGEASGKLDLVLAHLRQYYDMRASLRRAVLGASAYPVFVACFGFAVWTLLRVLTAVDKPAALWSMVGLLAALLSTIVAVTYALTRTSGGRTLWDGFILYVPVIGGAVRRLALARFARTLSMMYSSGIRIDLALDRACAAAANVHVVEDLQGGRDRVAQGDSLGDAFAACRFVPPRMREMLITGELAGTYDETLVHIAEIYEDEARQVLENLPKLIGPLMYVVIGALVVYLMYTFYLKPFVIDPVNEFF